MAYFNGGLWLSRSTGINIYNTRGALVKSIDRNQNDKNLFKYTPVDMAVTGETVIVADNSDGVFCLNKDGHVLGEMRDNRLKNSRGVCVSDDGTVFVCGFISNIIVMFNKDEKLIGELNGETLGLRNLFNFQYNRNKNALIVVSNRSNAISVLSFIDPKIS